jgi:hypothetical protein
MWHPMDARQMYDYLKMICKANTQDLLGGTIENNENPCS